MALDRRIDFLTGDFKRGPNGTFEMCDAIENKMGFSLNVPFDEWEGWRGRGNKAIRLLERAQDTDESLRLLELYSAEALQWLVEASELASVAVVAERYAPTIGAYQLNVTEPSTGRKFGPFFVQTRT